MDTRPFLLAFLCLAPGCLGLDGSPSPPLAPTGTPAAASPPTGAHVFDNTLRVGVQGAYASGMGAGQRFPATGIDGQQTNCMAFDPGPGPLASLRVEATWTAQSPLVRTLRFVVANGERSQVEVERTGPSPFSFTVPMDRIRPSHAGSLSYTVSAELSNETSDPKVAVSQPVDLTVHVGVASGPVSFSRASCASANR